MVATQNASHLHSISGEASWAQPPRRARRRGVAPVAARVGHVPSGLAHARATVGPAGVSFGRRGVARRPASRLGSAPR